VNKELTEIDIIKADNEWLSEFGIHRVNDRYIIEFPDGTATDHCVAQDVADYINKVVDASDKIVKNLGALEEWATSVYIKSIKAEIKDTLEELIEWIDEEVKDLKKIHKGKNIDDKLIELNKKVCDIKAIMEKNNNISN